MSGCLGAGVSLKQVLSLSIMSNVAEQRRTRSTGVAMPPPQLFFSQGRMSTEMKVDRSLLSTKTGTSGGIDVVEVMAG